MNMENPSCIECVNAYMGADCQLRCRLNGLKATTANAEGCKRYEREAGADAEESTAHRIWYCDGRGD